MFILLTASAARGVNFGADFAPTTAANMNGEYPFAPTPGGTPGKMPNWKKTVRNSRYVQNNWRCNSSNWL